MKLCSTVVLRAQEVVEHLQLVLEHLTVQLSFAERMTEKKKKNNKDQRVDNKLVSSVLLKQPHGLNGSQPRHSRTTKEDTFSQGGPSNSHC